LKSIAGAERPRSGTVTFDGARIDGMAQHMITRAASPMCGEPPAVSALSVRDNLRLGSYSIAASQTADEPLALVFSLFRGSRSVWSNAPKP